MTVALLYYNGTALVQRDLLEANQCPKCGTLGCVALADIAYKAPSHGKAEALWASVLTPVRCALCPTEYARRFDAGERVEEACGDALFGVKASAGGELKGMRFGPEDMERVLGRPPERNNLAEVDARRKAYDAPHTAYVGAVYDAAMHGPLKGYRGESLVAGLGDVDRDRRERALQTALGLRERRTLRERLVAAWRALWSSDV